MIYTRPFITTRFIAYGGDSRIANLVLAVQVVDVFSRQLPQVPLTVRLKERPAVRPVRGDHGFYSFKKRGIEVINGRLTPDEIPDGTYTLIVEPDPSYGSWYFLQPKTGNPWTHSFERSVALSSQFHTPVVLPMNPIAAPLEVAELTPTPAYPFPSNATLIRGKVVQAGREVATAVVSTDYREVDPQDSTQTVIVHAETITDRDGQFVLFFKRSPARNQAITIRAVKNGPPSLVNSQITEGTTNSLQAEISLP